MFSKILNTPFCLPCPAIRFMSVHLQRGGAVKVQILLGRGQKEDKGDQEAVTTLSPMTAPCSVRSTHKSHKIIHT